jgi:general secretion pathway protein C
VATVAELLRSNGGLGNQLISRAPAAAMVIIVLLIAWRAALLLALLAGPPPSTPLPDVSPVRLPARSGVDINSIQRSNLFGQNVVVLNSSNAPVTSMTLTLSGVVTAYDKKGQLDPKGGFALIGTTPTDGKNFRVGALLPMGVRLHEVYRDRVLLDRGGSIEALLLPPRAGTLPPPPPAPAPGAPAAGAASAQRVQQVIRDNPGIIRQIMTPSAVFENGKLKGMRVTPGPNRQAFDKLGLKTQDLVVAINGSVLSEQTRAEEVFNSMNSLAEANITVERGGARQEIHLNLAEIAAEADRMAQGSANGGPGQPPGPDSAR